MLLLNEQIYYIFFSLNFCVLFFLLNFIIIKNRIKFFCFCLSIYRVIVNMTFFVNFSNVETFFFDNVVAIVMKSRWMINMFKFDITDTSHIDDQNITNFLNKYENFLFDFKLIKFKKIKRLSRYCEIIIAQLIKIINY